MSLLGCTLASLVACQVVILGSVADRLDPAIEEGEACAFWPYVTGECCPEMAPVEEELPEPEALPDLGPHHPPHPPVLREASLPLSEPEPPCVRTVS